MKKGNRIFDSKQKGQGMSEYIIIVTLVAVLVLGAVRVFGTSIKAGFQRAATAVGVFKIK